VGCLWFGGALGDYWAEVWGWGRLYATNTFLENPLQNAAARTLGWLGFHAAIVIAAVMGVRREKNRLAWAGWLLLAIAGVAAGWRFFPRYFFLLLPPVVLLAARGMTRPGRFRAAALLLLVIPLARFGPRYVALALRGEQGWADTAMDRDSRAAAAILNRNAQPGDTLFVWGYRPELYVYTPLPAANRFLDSQPLTGVPADRHLTQSQPVETETARTHRLELARSWPVYIADGLSLYNPKLAIAEYPDLRDWFTHYREIGRSGQTVVYRLAAGP
jgi:hypothetical protein